MEAPDTLAKTTQQRKNINSAEKQMQYFSEQEGRIRTTTEHSTKEKKNWLQKINKKKENTRRAIRTHKEQL